MLATVPIRCMSIGKGSAGLGVALHQDADRALLAHRLLRRRDRARTADRDRQHQARKQHGVAHGDDDQRVRRQWRQMHRAARRKRLAPARSAASDWRPELEPDLISATERPPLSAR